MRGGWRKVEWSVIEARFSSCRIQEHEVEGRIEQVVSSLDVHRVLGVRQPHRRWMERLLSTHRPMLGRDVFQLDGSVGLVVEEGVVRSFAGDGGAVMISINLAARIAGTRRTEDGFLLGRYLGRSTMAFSSLRVQEAGDVALLLAMGDAICAVAEKVFDEAVERVLRLAFDRSMPHPPVHREMSLTIGDFLRLMGVSLNDCVGIVHRAVQGMGLACEGRRARIVAPVGYDKPRRAFLFGLSDLKAWWREEGLALWRETSPMAVRALLATVLVRSEGTVCRPLIDGSEAEHNDP